MAASRSGQETPQSGSSSKLMCFTHDEVITLIEAFNKHKHVLLKPGSHYQNYLEKRDAWLDISKTMNSKNPNRQRTLLQLKEKWKGLLKIARKDYDAVKQAAQRMEVAPDIGRYSEMMWDIYGSKIESRLRRRRSRHPKVPAPSLRSPNSASGRYQPNVQDEDSMLSVSDYYYDETPYSGEVVGAGFDHGSYTSHDRRERGDDEGNYCNTVNGDEEEDFDTDEYIPSPPKNNRNFSKLPMKDRSEDEGVEESEALGNAEENEMVHCPSPLSKRKYKPNEVMYLDETDITSMRRSLMKAKMSMIALQKSKIESELEKLDLEKEKLRAEKQKLEMEMLLLQNQMSSDSTELTKPLDANIS